MNRNEYLTLITNSNNEDWYFSDEYTATFKVEELHYLTRIWKLIKYRHSSIIWQKFVGQITWTNT